MKKRKILLPLLSIGSIATSAITITSCGNNFNLDKKIMIAGLEVLTENKQVNLKVDTTYKANIDLSKLDNIKDTDDDHLSIFVINDSYPDPSTEDTKVCPIENAHVFVNDKEIDDRTGIIENPDELTKNQFMLYQLGLSKDNIVLMIGPKTLGKYTPFKIEFKVKTSVKKYYLLFSIDANENI